MRPSSSSAFFSVFMGLKEVEQLYFQATRFLLLSRRIKGST
jgi:hypothetical protein